MSVLEESSIQRMEVTLAFGPRQRDLANEASSKHACILWLTQSFLWCFLLMSPKAE
jgi:hypothetical protein